MATTKNSNGSRSGGRTPKKAAAKQAPKKAAPKKRRPSARPQAAAAEPPKRRWWEHPFASPVIWSVISAIVGGVIYFGVEASRYVYDLVPVTAPEPFKGDRVGILIARLENDPGNEYALRVRSALEKQFPVAADGSAGVEIDLYPQQLALPQRGRLAENLAKASEEGRSWLEEQQADLLIWGRAVPTEKMLELRILSREAADGSPSGQPELYPITIPSEFSDQLGGALAGLVAGAGANAWNQRGGFLAPARAHELAGWMARLKNLQSELPEILEGRGRTELADKIETAYVQIGAALVADGGSEVALQVVQELFDGADEEGENSILESSPFLAAEIIADVVAQFSASAVWQVNNDEIANILSLIEGVSQSFKERHAEGKLGDIEYAYLAGLMAKLAGQLQARLGETEEARASYREAADQFAKLLDDLPQTQDQLSRARIQSYLGATRLGLAEAMHGESADAMLASSIETLEAALEGVSAEAAPRDAARTGAILAQAQLRRAEWHIDAASLRRSVAQMERRRLILRENERLEEESVATIQLATLLAIDAVLSSGIESARRSLELLEALAQPAAWRPDIERRCASLEDREQQGFCLARHQAWLLQQEALIERTKCIANLVAAYRVDDSTDELSRTAREHLETCFRHCEAVTAAAEKLGDALAWFDTQTLVADGLSIMGQRQNDRERLEEAIRTIDAAKERLPNLGVPTSEADAALTKAGALRALGELEEDADRLRAAIVLQREALPVYEGRQFTVQRTFAEAELGRSLAALAKLENVAGDELEEAIALLSGARERYAQGGASLAEREAARELEKAQTVLATLSTN